MSFSEILNILLGTGLMGLVVAVATMKATVRKANADAEKAKADAETVRITNTENATRILVENIVKPLKEELNATRTDLQATKKEMASTKREMARLRKAVEAASGCRHADYCPVLFKLRDNQKDTDAAGADLLDFREERHNCGSDQADSHAAGPGEPG
ncbi:hypothetical protein, partial [Xylanibacter rodentium]